MSNRRQDSKARFAMWLATRGSRNTGFVDRLCRRLLGRALELPEEQSFMKDDWVDSDTGYDPDELERYQRGE